MTTSSTPTTPLFVKTHDFLLWLIRHTQRFPKNLRQSYTLRLENMGFDFQEAILMANAVRGVQRSKWLETADGKLVCQRFWYARPVPRGRHDLYPEYPASAVKRRSDRGQSRCDTPGLVAEISERPGVLSTSAEVPSFNRVPIGPRFAANRGALPTRLNDIMPNYFCRGAYT